MAAALTALLCACGAPPEEVVARLAAASAQDWPKAARRALSPQYQDPRGGAELLIGEIGALHHAQPPWEISLSELRPQAELTARRVLVSAALSARWDGRPSWRVTGPVHIELERSDRWRVIGGWLWQLREARALVAAWARARRARDVRALGALLHGAYGQRADPKRAAAEAAEAPMGAISGVHLELREGGAHLDLYRRGRSPLRWTLRSEAGRLRILAGPLD